MIRVLRLMEYSYADSETMIADMDRWQVQGIYRPHPAMIIKSAVLSPEFLQEMLPRDAGE